MMRHLGSCVANGRPNSCFQGVYNKNTDQKWINHHRGLPCLPCIIVLINKHLHRKHLLAQSQQ